MDFNLLEYVLNHDHFNNRELNNKYRLKYHFTDKTLK
jgi:hypothetical protein